MGKLWSDLNNIYYFLNKFTEISEEKKMSLWLWNTDLPVKFCFLYLFNFPSHDKYSLLSSIDFMWIAESIQTLKQFSFAVSHDLFAANNFLGLM